MFASLIVVLAAIAVAFAAENRVFPEADVATFSSRYWISERIPVDSEIVKVYIFVPVYNNLRTHTTFKAVFVLKRDPIRAQKFESLLLDISNPKSVNFGKWLSKEQIIEMVSPETESVETVMKFLSTFGRYFFIC